MELANDHPIGLTSWARDRAKTRIHINDILQGGRDGYSCPGCDQEMVAVKCIDRLSYFRHYASELSPRKQCTYSDRDERYKIAKESIQRLRKIKVPVILKSPPEEAYGPPMKISDSKFIDAFEIKIEQYFYEDESHNIHMAGNLDDPNLKLLFKADAVFIDKNENPILLIHFVERHSTLSLTIDEKVALRSIGTDAVQVRIPKESAEAIERAFLTVENTKWILNNEYDRTKYERPARIVGGEIYSIDELQGQFLEENFNCRRAQINRLIRQITIHRESKAFNESAERMQLEVSRLDEIARGIREQEAKLEAETMASLQAEFAAEEREINRRRETLSRKKAGLARITIEV
jgi:hypothetical protein